VTPFFLARELPYRQTVRARGVGERKHILQTGQVCEYAHVELSIEPLPRGGGFQFAKGTAFHDSIPSRFLSYVEFGALTAAQKGLWGFPLVDVRVCIEDGSYHDVDSTALAFQKASTGALVEAMLAAQPLLLEQSVSLTVSVPEEYLASVFGDLNQRRFRITGTRQNAVMEVDGIMPQSELADFLPGLAGRTDGHALWSLKPSEFEELPESLTRESYCMSCDRKIRMPLVRDALFTEACLICGTDFESGPDSAQPGLVLKR
jgi:elongation factor G